MMLGEDEATQEPGSFASKSVWARISVIAAGPVFNFILAFLMSMIIVGSVGYDVPVLVGVKEGSPAAKAGLEAGDIIVKMNETSIHVSREITNYIMFHQGKTVHMVWEHEGERKEADIVPAVDEDGVARLGISVNNNLRVKAGPWETIKYGVYEVRYWILTTIDSLKMLFTGQVTINDMSGPVGVVDAIGTTYEQSKSDGIYYVWLNMLNISILLSANLGVMNLLPIPALDGGRLVFLIIEAVRRKRIDPEKEGMVHFVGLMALMLLMVVVMFNDVRKLF